MYLDYRNVILSEAAYGGLPVAAWMLDEVSGIAAADLMLAARGTNNAGTYVGSPTLGVMPGPINRSASGAPTFNGSSQCVSIADSAAIAVSSAMTVEAWVRQGSTFNRSICGQYDSSINQRSWLMQVETSNPPKLQVTISADGLYGSNVKRYNSTASLTVGEWSHVAFTWNGTTLALYVNGVLQTPAKVAAGAIAAIYNATCPLKIGAAANGAGATSYYDGRIFGVALYTYALAAARIQYHYLAGKNGLAHTRC